MILHWFQSLWSSNPWSPKYVYFIIQTSSWKFSPLYKFASLKLFSCVQWCFLITKIPKHCRIPEFIALFSFVCLFLARQPPVGQGLLIREFSRSHPRMHHSRYDSSGRVISSSQRPLPDTQHSQQKKIHAPGGIRTHNFKRWAATDLILRPRGHWDQQYLHLISYRTGKRTGYVSHATYICHFLALISYWKSFFFFNIRNLFSSLIVKAQLSLPYNGMALIKVLHNVILHAVLLDFFTMIIFGK
jgi:hypothetical protein